MALTCVPPQPAASSHPVGSERRIFQRKRGRLGEFGAVKECGTTGPNEAQSEGPFEGLNMKKKEL